MNKQKHHIGYQKKAVLFLATNLLTVLFTNQVFAKHPEPGTVEVLGIRYSGTGCPDGSVATNLSPDNLAMTILFDTFITELVQSDPSLASKNCDVMIDVATPEGWMFSVFKVDYRGFASIATGAVGELKTEYSLNSSNFALAGQTTLPGGSDIDYTISSNTVPDHEMLWSACQNNSGVSTLKIRSTNKVRLEQPRIATQDLHCASGGGRPATCPTGKKIKKLEMTRKVSASPCRENHSFGVNGSDIWVKHGCRADFRVTFEDDTTPYPTALLTVDSLDGEFKQKLGLAWQHCPEIEQTIEQSYTGLLSVTMDAAAAKTISDGRQPKQIFENIGLGHGDRLMLTAASGVSMARVYHGTPSGISACPDLWKIHFKNGSGIILAIPGQIENLKDLTSGIIVPPGAATAWIGYRDTSYFDNEGQGGSRTPRNSSTNGCSFSFKLDKIETHAD